MKPRVNRGNGFRGLLNYCFGPGERNHPDRGTLIGGNLSGTDPRSLAAEFAHSRRLRPDCKRPVWHCSLSLPAGEDLSDERFEEVARAHLENMGMDPDKHQWCLVRHVDTPHSHVHLIASRISLDGKLWHGQHEALRAIESCQELEKRFGLTLTPGLDSGKEGARINRKDIAGAQARGVAAHRIPKVQIAAALDEALQRSTSLDQFKDEAERLGVEVRYVSNSGGIYGVSYRLTDENQEKWFKGSQVGKAYSLNSIVRRLDGELDTPTGRRGPHVRQDILQRLKREKQDQKEILRWSNGYVAAVATDSEIRWRTGSSAESSVCAALAKERGWQEMILSDRGSDEKNAAAISAYHRAGISVQLNGQRYPSPAAPVTKQKEIVSNGNDGRDPRAGTSGSGAVAAIPGVAEVDGSSGERPAQKTELRHGTNRGSAGAAGKTHEDGERHRPDAEKAATGATHEGEDMEDILDFLDESPAIQARDAAALEELAAAKPGDHNLQLLAGELEAEEKKTSGAEGAGSASAPRAPAPAVPTPPAISSAGTGVREEEEDRAALEEIEAQLQDIYQESDWQAYWQQLPRREYRIQRDEAMPYAAARALALGHRREAVARVAGEKATARAEKHVADPAKRAVTQQKAAGAKVRVDQNRQAEDKRLAEKAKDWANQKPKSKEGWKK
ncbi:MAG: relaxase/mobilization nuclease domain-containing protein [Candidatus Hydrogenedentes bacterium]|nr:relaxase/mobilization nuclease domain-containing protein [Candidatus Hydrogenedentota bacterium]